MPEPATVPGKVPQAGGAARLIALILGEKRRPLSLLFGLAALYSFIDASDVVGLFPGIGYFPLTMESLASVLLYAAAGLLGAERFRRPAGRADWISLPVEPDRKYQALALAWGLVIPLALAVTMTLCSSVALVAMRAARHWYIDPSLIVRSLAGSVAGFPAAIVSLCSGLVFRRLRTLKLAGLLLAISLGGSLAINLYVRSVFDPSVASGVPWGLFLDPNILLYRSLESSGGFPGQEPVVLARLTITLENLSLAVSWALLPVAALILGKIGHQRMEAAGAFPE